MNIVGLTFSLTPSAVCVLRDGALVDSMLESTLSRRAGDTRFPHRAIDICLERQKLQISDIDQVVFAGKPFLWLERELKDVLDRWPAGFRNFLAVQRFWFTDGLRIGRRLTKAFPEIRPRYCTHAEALAAYSFFNSRLPNATIITQIATGENPSTTVWKGEGGTLSSIKSHPSLRWNESELSDIARELTGISEVLYSENSPLATAGGAALLAFHQMAGVTCARKAS